MGSYIATQDRPIRRALQAEMKSSDPAIRTKDTGSCVPRKRCVQSKMHEQSFDTIWPAEIDKPVSPLNLVDRALVLELA